MKSLFTKEQIDELRLNPYTYHVSNTTIKFTEEFKDAFWRLYLQDMPLRDIVRTLGYDYDVLGEKRVGGFIYNLRKNRLTPEQRVASSSPQRLPILIIHICMPAKPLKTCLPNLHIFVRKLSF